jgi:hypothetical protein
MQDMRQVHAEDLPVVEVHVGATKFKSIDSAKMKPLTSLFAPDNVRLGSRPAPAGIGVAGLETPTCTRVKRRRGERDSADSPSREAPSPPRLWPVMSDSVPNNTGYEQQSDTCEDAVLCERGSGVAAEAVDVDGSRDDSGVQTCAAASEQPCFVGFGSPIGGLINSQDVDSSKKKSLNNASQGACVSLTRCGLGGRSLEIIPGVCLEVDARSADAPVVLVNACKDSNAVCTSSLHGTGARRKIEFSSDCSNAENWTCNADVTPFDPSAQQTLSAEHKLHAANVNQLGADGRSAPDSGKVIDFAELLGAWQRDELGGSGVKLVADAIMRGLKRC